MKICGVVAEYNPFHNGHARHLAETRRRLGEQTAVVCVMSGNYVQRGDLAIVEKYRRAQAAAQCGADLVLELPLPACLCSASGFAWGAVSLLDALGCVTHLSFGAEHADLSCLQRAAELSQCEENEIFQQGLSAGLSYAAAMQQAVIAADPEAGALLSSPNNTLAVEYLSALQTLHSIIEPIAIKRIGGAHDSTDTPDHLPSASYLRSLLAQGNPVSCRPLMPEASFEVLKQAMEEGAAPVLRGAIDCALLAHLRRFTPEMLRRYLGGEDGLEYRLADAIRGNVTFDAICAAAQTRRYPLARVRRVLLRAWLDLPHHIPPEPAYVRVLAIGARGREILRRMKTTCSLPVIVKPTTARRLPDTLQPALARDALADDLYALACPAPTFHVGGGHFRKTPYTLP